MCPLCSSMRATPLKIITTARRSVHTFIGSKEAFRTKTRAFMIEADITRVRRKVSKFGVRSPGGQFEKWHGRPARGITRKMRVPPQADPLPVRSPRFAGILAELLHCEQDAREPPTRM